MTCKCKWCEEGREIKAIKGRRNTDELIILVDKLWNDLGEVSNDLNYHQAIMDGSWPFAKEKAEEILKRVAERSQSNLALEA